MRHTPRAVVFGLVAALMLGGIAHATDPRVEGALKELDMPFTMDDDGTYHLVVRWEEDGRSQLVLVESNTEMLDGIEIREVWSVAYTHRPAELPATLAQELLERNGTYLIGAWESSSTETEVAAIFNARIPAACSAKELASVVNITGTIADELEKELLGSDEL